MAAITNSGMIITIGDGDIHGSGGITSRGASATITNTNSGSIITEGEYAYGIYSTSRGTDATITNSGMITATG